MEDLSTCVIFKEGITKGYVLKPGNANMASLSKRL